MRWWLVFLLAHLLAARCQHVPHGTSRLPDLAYVFDYPFNVHRIPGDATPWCYASSPNAHLSACKASAQCSPWYPSMIHEPPLKCMGPGGSFGACCPDVFISSSTVARFPEFSKLVAMPREITPAEMNHIVTSAKRHVEEIASFESKAWSDMLSHWKNSAGFSSSANSRAALLGQQEGWKALQGVEASRKLAVLLKLDPAQAGFALQNIDVKQTSMKGTCREEPTCDESYPYRSIDGSCNNLKYPNWGRSNSPLERILPPQYLDGIWGPREWPGIPTVDSVSSIVQDLDVPDNQLTSAVMHWGQLIAHDLTHVPTFRTLNNTAIQCCTFDGKYLVPEQTHPLCFAIDVSRDHEFYGKFGVSCQHFVRSLLAPREDCKLGYAEQLNQNTAYLDGSAIYGSTDEVAASLRQLSGGKLRVTVFGDYHLLPKDLERQDCIADDFGGDCFVAGDVRVNQYPGLTAMHTIWVRFHNRIAHELAQVNPTWDDEKLFQETRRIVAAVIQHITYNEYLPATLGPKLLEDYGLLPLTTGYAYTYNPAVKAQITNEFATGAFRYGHSLVRNSNELWLDDTYSNYGGELFLKDWYNNPKVLFNPLVFNALIRHFITGSIQNFDDNVADSVHHFLFKPPFHSWGLDLISANLWRARDHGIPGYNFYLEACGYKRAANFEDLQSILRPSVVEKIRYLYKSVDDIDIYIGILGEWPVKGGILGPVASCIIADQFARLKDGDRFFYENGMMPHSFTPEQLETIRQMSLARVFCDVADSVEWITPKVFWTPSDRNPWLWCGGSDIPRLDLNRWKSQAK